jgi:hypothetical protein
LLTAIYATAAVSFSAIWAALDGCLALVEFFAAFNSKPDGRFPSLLFPSIGIHMLFHARLEWG